MKRGEDGIWRTVGGVPISERQQQELSGSATAGPSDHAGLVKDILRSVAHVGVDFGYGPYQIEDKFIAAAREILEGPEAIAALSRATEAATCFECDGPLNGPYCPACRDATPPAPQPALAEEANKRLRVETIEECARWHEERHAAMDGKPVWQMLSSHLEYAASLRSLADAHTGKQGETG